MGRGKKSDRKSGKQLRTVGSHRGKRHPRNEEEFEEQEGGQDQYCTDDKPESPEWVIEIKKCLDKGLTYDSWTIYRIPKNLCKLHKTAFRPKMVSIGPFHYYDKEEKLQLQVMEGHKKRFLVRLLGGKLERRRSNGDMSMMTEGERQTNDSPCEEGDDGGRMANLVRLDDLVEAMQKLEQKTRACYSESFDEIISSPEFVRMMVVDGCFLVELLRLYFDHVSTKLPVDDPIFTTSWMLRTLQRDLLMLENQLPFFVVEELFKLINNNIIDRQAVSLEVLAVTFFDPLLPRENAATELNTKKPYAHLLDVFRSTFLKSVREKVDEKGKARVKVQLNPDGRVSALVRERQLIHFASELQEVGVRFKKGKGKDLLDIDFAHGTLLIPPLSVDDNTVPLFLNFVAYEQCHDHAKPFFTDYFMFWDSLVNGHRDIQILHKHGIINHVLGSNGDVANLLNKLCREIVYDLDQCYLYNEIKEVNDYCKLYDESKYRVWWRNLIRERFSSPWTCLSLFAAIILLLLTLLQTVYTVYPYYRPH